MNIKITTLFCFVVGWSTCYAQQELSPEDAVSYTLDNNYGIKVANKELEVSENNTSIYNSGYLPSVTGSAGATYNLDNNESEFSDGNITKLNGAESSNYNASLDVNYTLFDGLGRKYNYQSLKEQYQLSELQVRETIENTIIELFTIYYNVAQLSENADTFQQTLSISKDRLVRSEYQFEYGQNTKLEVLNAEVDINNDSINVINTNQQLNNTKRDLNLVMGNVLNENFKVNTEINFLLDINKEALLQKAKSRNVALMQADKSIQISELDIKSGKSSYLPTLGLTGSYGWNKNNNNAASFLAGSTNTGLSAGLNLSWNIFDGGSTKTLVKNAEIALQSQEIQKEEILLSLERDFNNAWDDYQNKLTIFRVQENNIVTAQNNFDRSQEKFKIGQVNSIEFRQAQLNLLNAELSRNQAKYEAKLSELQVLQLSGELLNIAY
ncbi:TolC family protein [Oceanihabitans sp. 2_MG-2023]|uniref:TolC family protein n=1 Tax=Oceanihabitans sp. 2_MG-2023 TaxID=3062661 RepID=UPI0026E278B7|nr:TolC family protein [Oceanihabitans sp. 2_MG-2023]MDO6596146.1 TolC family protein [Oceanihabitans sp. 2_MG-2023]